MSALALPFAPTHRRRVLAGGMLMALAGLLGGLVWVALGQRPARAIPVPLPVYSIDAVSGSHHASLLNLPIGQPGVAQVPIPVDVAGDLIPDVTVAVNL